MSKQICFTDKNWKEQLEGATFNKKLEDQIIGARINEARKNKEYYPDMTMVTVLSPKDHKIKDIGFNKPNDLLLDNFGNWIAGLALPTFNSGITKTLKNDAGNNIDMYMGYLTGAAFYWNHQVNVAPGFVFRLGSSSVAPARTDYKIGAAFATAVSEGTWLESSYGMYTESNASSVFAGACVAGSVGVLKEAMVFSWWGRSGVDGPYYFALTHDAINPVSFGTGDVLCATCTISI